MKAIHLLTEHLAGINHRKGFENDPVAFLEDAGSRLHRRKIIPDDWQAEVLSSKARYKIINTSRQVGKSTVIAGLALHKARYLDDALVLIFAPTQRQAKEVFAKIIRFYLASIDGFNNRPLLKRLGIDSSAIRQMGIQLDNSSRIEALPGTEHTARGYTADLIIIDEAAFATDGFYASILPSLAVSDGELVLASTPFGKRGFFYDEWVNGEGFDRFEVTARRCPRMSEDFLRREYQRRGARHFRQEYMCQFEELEDAVFRGDIIEAAYTDEVHPLWEDFAKDSAESKASEEAELENFMEAIWSDFDD